MEGKNGRIHRVKRSQRIVAILATLLASVALAEDFKTIEGKEYKDVTVSRVEPDGIVLTTKTGISKVYFIELPRDVQERFLPSTPKISVAQRGLITFKSWVKSWAGSVKNPTSYVLFLIGAASLIVAGLAALVRSLLRKATTKGSLTDRADLARRRRL